MEFINLDGVQEATEGKRIPAGGYICQIRKVTNNAEQKFLKFDFDIADGEYAGHFGKLAEGKEWWGGNFIQSYKENSLPFFKAFVTACEKSNGFKFDGKTEQLFVGKIVGLIISDEEYVNKTTGEVKIRFACKPRSIDLIKSGNFEIPELKKLPAGSAPTPANTASFGSVIPDEDIPF